MQDANFLRPAQSIDKSLIKVLRRKYDKSDGYA